MPAHAVRRDAGGSPSGPPLSFLHAGSSGQGQIIRFRKKAGQNGIGYQHAVPGQAQVVRRQGGQTCLLEGRQQVGHVLRQVASREGRIQGQGQTAGGAQAQHEGFPQAHGRGKPFGIRIRCAGRKADGPGIQVRRLGPAPAPQGGGGRRPHAQIVRSFPVALIVSAFPARVGKIGNFVLVKAVRFQQGSTLVEHAVLFLVRGQVQAAAGTICVQGRAFLPGQAIGRDMVRAQPADRCQGLPPLCGLLTGQGPHEVHAQIAAAGITGGCHGPQAVRRAVRPPQAAQLGIVQGLQAQGKTIDACPQIGLRHAGIGQGFWIGLHTDFCLGGQGKAVPQRVQHLMEP